MNDEPEITIEEYQKDLETFSALLKQLLICRIAKQDFEWQAYNMYAGNIEQAFSAAGQSGVEHNVTTQNVTDDIYTDETRYEDYLLNKRSLGSGGCINECTLNRKYYTGYNQFDSSISEYYPYTITLKRLLPNKTLCHVQGLKNPIQQAIKAYLKEIYNYYMDAYDVTSWSYDPDDWDSYMQYETMRSHYIQLRNEFYSEFVSHGCGDPDDPVPAWAWGNFTAFGDMDFNLRATCPHMCFMIEDWNERIWEGTGHRIDFTENPAPILVSTHDYDMVDIKGELHPTGYESRSDYEQGVSGFLLDANNCYAKGLMPLGDDYFYKSAFLFSFVPSVDSNGNWMSDTINFDFACGFITSEGLSISEACYLPQFLFFELGDLCDEYGWEATIQFVERFYAIPEHQIYNKYMPRPGIDPEPWTFFIADYPDFDVYYRNDYPQYKIMLRDYIRDNFSINYLTDILYWKSCEFLGIDPSDPDETEWQKIKNMVIKVNPKLTELWET